MTLIAQLNGKGSNEIIWSFKSLNQINGIHDRGHKRYTIDKLKSDKAFFSWVLHFIKYLEISNLATTEEDVNEINLETPVSYTHLDVYKRQTEFYLAFCC